MVAPEFPIRIFVYILKIRRRKAELHLESEAHNGRKVRELQNLQVL